MRRLILFCALGAALLLTACDEQQLAELEISFDENDEEAVDEEGSAEDGANILPNWATPEELEWQAEHPDLPFDSTLEERAAPPAGYRLPAEYEPTKAVVITWTSYTTMLGTIARNVAAADAEVWAVGGPTSITGVPAAQYKRLSYSYNSVWSRDYGPVGINEATQTLGIVDPTYRHYATRTYDDAIPCKVATYAGASCYTTSLILDGGNLMTDGLGNLFLTRRIYSWNSSLTEAQVDQLLKDYFGATTIHKFDYAISNGQPADGTGHIDMFAKILKDCTVLVAQTTTTPFAAPLDAAANYFANLTCAASPTGEKYTVLRVPGWKSGSTWYTYTNSLIVNDYVLVPSYTSGYDSTARSVYEQALPDHTIVMIASDSSITSGGSIHCITKEIPEITAPVGNIAPVANAGADQSVQTDDIVTLNGSASSDANGDALTYAWTQTAGTAVTLSDSAAVNPTFTAPIVTEETTLTFSLVVNDGELSSAADTVNIVVSPPSEWDVEMTSTDTPKNIPDYNSTGITSTISVSEAGSIAAMEVDVNITHTYIGNLIVKLKCPSGTSVTLHNRTGGSADNIVQTYTVTGCDGQTAAGSYQLNVSDRARYYTGKLNSWGLRIQL